MASTHCICRHSYSAAVRRQALAGAIRHASSKPSPSTSDKNVANKQQSAFTDTILSSTVSSPADANSDTTSVAGTPASDSRVNSDAATGGRGKFPSQQNWLKGQEGQRFKRPIIGRTNWLGRTPFPLNPSFKPPTPLSDATKSKIYTSFKTALASASSSSSSTDTKSETYHARMLSSKYGISIDRVKAVVRLKALEENLSKQGVELQLQFLRGMEEALAVPRGQSNPPATRREATDVDRETKALYKTGRRTQWRLVDEENPADVEEVEALTGHGDDQSDTSRTAKITREDIRPGKVEGDAPRESLVVQASKKAKDAPQDKKGPNLSFTHLSNAASARYNAQDGLAGRRSS